MKSLQEYFEQERVREPIVDAVGVERFVEGVDAGHRPEPRSWKISAAGIVSAFLLTMVIVVISTLFGTEGDEGGSIMAHRSDARSRLLVDTPQVDRLTPSPSNEKRDEVGRKDSSTPINAQVKRSRKRQPTKPVADADEAAITEPATARRPTLKTTDVKRDGPDTVIKNLERSTVADPKRSARLLRDSIANANALRTLHIDGITPLALNAQELWRLGVRIEPDTIRIIPGGRSASGLLTYVYPLSKGRIRSSFIAEDADSTSPAAMLALGGGMYPPHTWIITEPSGVVRMSTLGVPSFRSGTTLGKSDTAALADQQDLWNLLDSASPERMSPAELTRILADAKKKAVARDTYNPNHLIPIRAAAADAPDSVGLILWYDPSPHLLSRLPRWVWLSLRDQIDLVDTSVQSADDRSWSRYTSALLDSLLSIRESEAEGRGGSRPHPGESLLGIGRASAGAIASSIVSPNPIGGETKLFYELTEARTIAAGLYDLHGVRVKEFFSLRRKEEGQYRIPLDVSGVPAGVYLVALVTDQGERAVQRVVVP